MTKIFREKRQNKNLSLNELSRLTKIDPSLLSKIENALRRPTDEQIDSLASVLELTSEEVEILKRNKGGGSIPLDNLNSESEKISPKESKRGGENIKMDDKNKFDMSTPDVQITVPGDVRSLYSDASYFKVNEYGVTIDFAQTLHTTNQQTVVARVGLSKEHCREMVNRLNGLLQADLHRKEKVN